MIRVVVRFIDLDTIVVKGCTTSHVRIPIGDGGVDVLG